MNEANLLRMRESRCAACRVPADVLGALQADRCENGMTFEELVAKYGVGSPSGLRRHFARHVAMPANVQMAEKMLEVRPATPEPPTPDSGVARHLDPHELLEAGTRTLAEMVETLARDYRDALAVEARHVVHATACWSRVIGAR